MCLNSPCEAGCQVSAAAGDPAAARVRRRGGVMSANWTRRQALRRGGAAAAGVAGLGLAGYIGYSWPHPASTDDAPAAPVKPPAGNGAASATADVDHFVTRSDIRPPAITVTRA